jgi:small subunit ribosomal protein S1
MTIKGIVKNITDYGAFVDLGAIDGLLHITDLAWRRIKHPSEILAVGDEIEAKVLKFDQDKNRVSLGMKQLAPDPWIGLSDRYPKDTKLFGGVTNLTDYGAFVEIEKGIEGLVHVSEMDWLNKNVNPSKFVQLGDEVEVVILEIDENRRRISLGMKQCQENPWEAFANHHAKGDKIKGVIKSITDFGIFVGLPNGIDGLVHIHDLSWDESGEEAIKCFTKGEEIEIVLLSVDAEKERVSLGIKQLEEDKFGNFISTYIKDTEIQGIVKSFDEQGIVVTLEENIEGTLPAAEVVLIREKSSTFDPKVGDEIAVIITAVDRKSHLISLSVKVPEAQKSKAKAVKKPRQDKNVSTGTTNLGVLLKAKFSGDDNQ